MKPNGPDPADKAMRRVFDEYMRQPTFLFVPDTYTDIPGFTQRFEHLKKMSIICGESWYDDVRKGNRVCTKDEGHSGSCDFGVTAVPEIDIGRSLQTALNQEQQRGEG